MADFQKKLIQNSLFLCLKTRAFCNKPCEELLHPLREDTFMINGYEVAKKPICIGSELHKFQIQDDADKSEIEIESILEPVSKNTAAAMAVIANFKAKEASDFLVFCPADHYIQDTNRISSLLQRVLTRLERRYRLHSGKGHILLVLLMVIWK